MRIIESESAIVGAGPVGLFAAFALGINNIKTCIIDTLNEPGGQCAQFYPYKYIYDIPGMHKVLAHQLISNLMDQIEQFEPEFLFNSTVMQIIDSKGDDYVFDLITSNDTIIRTNIVFIATGAGILAPNKLKINGSEVKHRNVQYCVQQPGALKDRKIVILGGGDSAIDWTLELVDIAERITLIHRRDTFRAIPSNVNRIEKLVADKKVDLIITEIDDVKIEDRGLVLSYPTGRTVLCDNLLVFYGFSVDTNVIYESWGLELYKKSIIVNMSDFSTNRERVFAVGDVNYYENKSKLILCGFHEATLAAKRAFKLLNPNKKFMQKYTTVDPRFKS